MSNKISKRAVYEQARKYLDIKSVFPKSSGVGRGGNLTDYQARKLAGILKELKTAAGGDKYLEQSFVPIRRTKGAKEYIESIGLPKYSKGVLLAGGERVNSGLTVRGGALYYTRGERPQAHFPLDTRTENTLEKSIMEKAGFINNPENVPYIATHGGAIKGLSVNAELEGDNAAELLNTLAQEIYSKYKMLADAGAYRPADSTHGLRKAAHPSKWGLSLLVEAK